MDEYTADQATHKLACVHAQGRSRKHYTMKCIKLGETPSGKVKVLVFGRLFWRDTEHVKAVRYVDPDRLVSLSNTEVCGNERR
jgi:hypothetical protein